MRWGGLQVPGSARRGSGPGTTGPAEPVADPADAQLALFGRDEVVARTFDTPAFAGTTFYEVQARSILNKVPASSRMGFGWTINPYRGCSHACVYCLDPDTPVLLADGTERPIGRLEIGDPIVGTVPGGRGRHVVVTHVRAIWHSRKTAFRIRLSDGRALIASADHRFLTETGWAYVAAPSALEPDPDRPADAPVLRAGALLVSAAIAATGDTRSTRPVVSVVGRAIPPDARTAVIAIEPLTDDEPDGRPMVDITTGTGDFVACGVVSHNCFARNTHTYLDLDAGHDFDTRIVVKVNAPELLRRELAKPSWAGELVAMGTNVDCYQRAEGRYRLMPRIIDALAERRNPFSILTKGTLLLRDLARLREAAQVTSVDLAYSIGLTDEDLWRSVEPGTPSPRARLHAVRTLTDAGFDVGVLMAPVLPFLSDDPVRLEATVRAIAEAGAVRITPLALHLRPGAREWYLAWLAREHPSLVPRYRALYGDRSYAPRSYQQRISARVTDLAEMYGVGEPPGPRWDPASRVRGGA